MTVYLAKRNAFASIREEEHILESERNQRQRCNGAKQKNMDADLVLAAVLRFFPFDFQTAVSTASEDVAAECAGEKSRNRRLRLRLMTGRI